VFTFEKLKRTFEEVEALREENRRLRATTESL